MELTFWTWLACAAILLGFEILMPGAMMLWVGIAAAITAVAALVFPDMHWLAQSALFAVLAVASVFVSMRYFPAKKISTDDPQLNQRMQRYVGQVAKLETAVVNGRARIKLADGSWPVMAQDLPDGAPEGTNVKILRIESDLFVIEKYKGPN